MRKFILLYFIFAATLLHAQPSPPPDPSKIQVLVITGQNVHDWRGTTPILKQILEDTKKFEVRVVEEFRGAGPETLANYDLVVVNYYNRGDKDRWGERAQKALEDFVRSGKGLVVYHISLGAFDGWGEYEKMSGGNWRPNYGHHSAAHAFTVDIKDNDHPITRGLKSFAVPKDELYANLRWQPEGSYHVLATAYDDHALYNGRSPQPIPGPGIHQPILWTTEYGKGRVFITTLGHGPDEVRAAGFGVTFARGAEWAAKGTVTLPIPPELAAQAANPGAPDHPSVTVQGRTYTPQSILTRNMGTPEDQSTAFPPHKIIGNVYYVGTRTLSSFLVVTPQGNILIDSTYERNVKTIEKSVEQLGFKFSDTKILLGSHAHGDHQEGDALVKQMTGAQVMAMAEDVPALQAMKPGGKAHPVDKVLHDGDSVTLGGTTLVAHLTPGHTRGCTTWTMKVQEGGKTNDVVIHCSLRSPTTLTPAITEEFNRSFKLVHALPCDVPLGDHPAQYNMQEKYAKVRNGAANPFIDPAGCKLEPEIEEAMFHAILKEQQK